MLQRLCTDIHSRARDRKTRFGVIWIGFFGILIPGCATPRSVGILGLNYSDQPARVAMRWECNKKTFTSQGIGVCEQRLPSVAKVSIKIPPLEGRVIYSNGQLKKTEDFNWYPKEGFWLWKSKPIKDTWADLDLGEINATYGDWPVALDVAAVSGNGVIVTRGMLYHRICNDDNIPCSKLVVVYECAGSQHATGVNQIGQCARMSGSPQAFKVILYNAISQYAAKPGAKIYVSAPRLGPPTTYTLTADDFANGLFRFELPNIPVGPMLVGIRMAWIEDGKTKTAETRVLVLGFSPAWTGLDQPHFLDQDDHLDFVKPVMADVLEANLYEGQVLKKKSFSSERVTDFPKPTGAQVACAFAWQRESSDQTAVCLNSQLKEVDIP